MKISNFECSDVDYTESHTIDIIKELEDRQTVNPANDLTLLGDAIDSFLDIIANELQNKEMLQNNEY